MEVDSDQELLMENDDNEEEVESEDSDSQERALELRVADLENQIAQNRFAYQPYVELITTLKSLVDLDRLRAARKKMANQFPLSPELWTDWIQDEINVATTLEEKQYIIDLFESAVKDYLSVDIWLQYITFMICFQNEQSSGKCTQTRKVFEEALTAAGLHVTQGSLLWDTYIEYELSNLKALEDKPEEYNNQLKLIANLYKRQLSCPLKGMENTYEKFQKWLSENSKDDSEPIIIDKTIVENIYKKAKEKLDKILPFEEALLSQTENAAKIYAQYLEHEKSKEGSPVRVQCLYERILCENCLSEDFWMEYIEYVNRVLNNCDVVLSICKRALRNCPWVSKLYQAYLKCLERFAQPKNLLTTVVEDAFECGLQEPTDFRDIWMSYLEYLRRYFDCPSIDKEEEEKRLAELRVTFSRAFDYMSQLENADPDCIIAQFWARIEANYCKNMEKSRELWNIILSEERNKTAEMWLEYIHLERTFGDSKHLKKLFPRALQHTKDWPESIAKVWVNYERDEGTLESFEICLNKINVKMNEVQEQRQRERSDAEVSRSSDFVSKKFKKGALPKSKEKNHTTFTCENENKRITGYKRSQIDNNEETTPSKKPRVDENGEQIVDKEQTNEELVKKLLEDSKKSHGETVVHDSSKDHRTVFVSNLDFSTEESAIRESFSMCGTITDLRLVKDYKGRSKGYCYVEYKNAKEAQDALKKDRELINGRPMFVSKCDPDKETRGNAFKYSAGLEKNKIFIRGLPFTTTAEDLRNLFSDFGALKDVRLVTYRNGHSKGLAYVEFEDEAAAAQAVLKTDRTMIQDKEISVAISNPPGRKAETSLSTKLTPSLGGGFKESGPRGRGRTQISFLPRSVQLSKQSTATDSLANLSITSPVPENEQTKLNNSDFRKLLG